VTFEQRKTPGGQTGGIQKNHHSRTHSADSSIADSVDRGDVFGQMLNGIYIVVAEIKPLDGEQRFRRRFYAGLTAAQRAVDRAHMQGREAYLYIGQVTIVGGDAR